MYHLKKILINEQSHFTASVYNAISLDNEGLYCANSPLQVDVIEDQKGLRFLTAAMMGYKPNNNWLCTFLKEALPN